MKAKSLAILLTLAIISGCGSTPPPRTIPLPSCDQPIPITSQIWNDLDLMRDVMSDNALRYQECIQKYRSRIEAFNEDS